MPATLEQLYIADLKKQCLRKRLPIGKRVAALTELLEQYDSGRMRAFARRTLRGWIASPGAKKPAEEMFARLIREHVFEKRKKRQSKPKVLQIPPPGTAMIAPGIGEHAGREFYVDAGGQILGEVAPKPTVIDKPWLHDRD